MISQEIKERFLKIKAVLMDVDGVLTDGRIVFGSSGDELKFFDVQDGLGLVMLQRSGFKTAWVSSRKSKIVQRRAKDLSIHKVFENTSDKLKVCRKLEGKFKVQPEEICFIGDDLVDLEAMKRVGLAIAVGNAVPEVKEVAHYVTERKGGSGAVREVADLLIKTQSKWDQAVQVYGVS